PLLPASFAMPGALLELPTFPPRRSSDLFRRGCDDLRVVGKAEIVVGAQIEHRPPAPFALHLDMGALRAGDHPLALQQTIRLDLGDRKSTRLNSSHVKISYCDLCLNNNST